MNLFNTDVIQILSYSNSCFFYNENEGMVLLNYINRILEILF